MPCPIYRLPPYTVAPAEHVLSQVVPWNVLGYGIPDIWKETKGEGIKVAVIDTGIDLNHPDLKDQIADAQDFTGSPYGPQDRQGHGTHVSGTIAAIDNGVGVIGVAPSAKLLVAKVLGDDGSGASNNVAAGIMWAISKGADIISMSLGGPQDSSDIDQAVMAALAAGIQVVCAAGNDGQTNSVNWPAKLSPTTGVIAVAAVDRDGHLAPYSSLGPEVDIAGPGSDILSDAPGGGLATMSGTCIAKGSYVYGPLGPKPIEQVSAGDVVYAFKDGKLVQRVVAQNHYRGTNTLYKIRAAGRDVTLTETHQVMAINKKSRDFEWVKASDVNENHILVMPKALDTQINPYLDSTLSEEFCWILGFFLGDGWLGETSQGRRVSFAEGDKVILIERVREIWKRLTGKQLKDSGSGWLYDDNTRMAATIDVLGMNHKAIRKTIPYWVWNLSREKQLAFYKGYRAADGHLYRHPCYKTPPEAFECGSLDLMRRMAIFADYQGWKHSTVASRTRENKAPNSKPGNSFTCHNVRIFRSEPAFPWSAFGTKKSMSKEEHGRQVVADMGLDTDRFFAGAARFDELGEKGDVYDLSVPDADCFVTQGLVTHNSMATPFISGSLALYLSRLKAIGAKKPLPADVKQELHNTAQDAGPTGRDTGYGWGLIRPASILLDADKQAVSNKPQPPVTDALAFRIPNVTLGGFTGSLVFQRD